MAKVSAMEMLRRVQQVKNKTYLQQTVNELLIKDETTLKRLKEQDYLEGDIYGDGTLRRYRSVNYEIFKSRKNPLAGGAVDLIDTGQFVNAMFLEKPNGNKYLFGNTDWKKKLLTDKYGSGIFGLNQDVFNKYQNDIIKPRFIKELQKILNK